MQCVPATPTHTHSVQCPDASFPLAGVGPALAQSVCECVCWGGKQDSQVGLSPPTLFNLKGALMRISLWNLDSVSQLPHTAFQGDMSTP